jgi:hypothetical protein
MFFRHRQITQDYTLLTKKAYPWILVLSQQD